MKEYRVTYRKADHRDEWPNEYSVICIKDEEGNFVCSALHESVGFDDFWVEFETIDSDSIIRVENL